MGGGGGGCYMMGHGGLQAACLWTRTDNMDTLGEGWGVLAPSLGTHCGTDPKSGCSESRDRRGVTAPYP